MSETSGSPSAAPWPAALALGVLALLAGGPAWAQAGPGGSSRVFLGGGVTVSVPRGEFGDFVDEGLGLGGTLRVGLDPAAILALRLDASVVTYGSERFTVPLSTTVSRVFVDVVTRNNIFLLGLGPQLGVPYGPLRPYLNGVVGLGYFFTESEVRGSSNPFFDDFARTTNFDDLSFAYGAGGGLGLALSGGRRPFLLVLDLQVRNHGRTRYLREGSITEDGTGRIFLDPLESDADVLLVQLGVSFGL